MVPILTIWAMCSILLLLGALAPAEVVEEALSGSREALLPVV